MCFYSFISAYGVSVVQNIIKGKMRTVGNTIRDANNNTTGDVREFSENVRIPNPNLKVFMFADLESATRNFSQDLHLGRGYFGHLFLGWIERSRLHHQDVVMAALSLLGQLVHPTIVGLLGYCLHGDENMLVYEYYENRTLDIFLFTNAPDISKPLSWEERLRIMIGVARGLTYLHSSKDQIVCHGIQSSDILLDQVLFIFVLYAIDQLL
ncbi:putative protein kinase RLK-Pelle-RLCK-VIIa-2 family [Helianthus annuus]|nr:putative protein kinase RLK-Pelle-RLCK-VIIa-2 family [Helianthus annuus]